MADVEFGFVHDFGAERGVRAAPRGGRDARIRTRFALPPRPSGSRSSGSSRPSRSGRCRPWRRWTGKVYRLRVVGSIAITAAYVGAGRFDAMLSLRPCRSVDAAAAQLIVREAGGAVAFGDLPLDRAPLDLDARYPIAAGRGSAALETARGAQRVTEVV